MRKPEFNNQLAKRILRKKVRIPQSYQPNLPPNVSFPQGDKIEVVIPSQQELKEDLRNLLNSEEGQIKIPKVTKEDFIK